MRILVDVSPISSDSTSSHKVRGVGMYISLLKDNLEKFDKDNKYIFSSNVRRDISSADVVHYPYMDPFFVTFPIIKRKKTVITVHDLIPIQHRSHFPAGIKGSASWQVNKRILKQADGIITDSMASKKAVERIVGIKSSKVTSVLLGISPSFKPQEVSSLKKSELTNKFNLPSKFFLYVGDVTWNKNLPKLIEAIKMVNIPLVMVGKALVSQYDHKNPWNKDRNYVEKETQSDFFVKTGFVSDEELVSLYNMSIALCMPSIDEGFGLPVLEAMSCARPVFVSDCGSLPEVAGGAGLYVNFDSAKDISEKLQMLLGDEDLQQALSKKSLVQSKEFSIEKMIKDTVSVYSSIK